MLQTDTYTLYVGDCLDVMAGLEAQSVDAVITDPPYGMGKNYHNDSDKEQNALRLVDASMPHLARLLRTGGMAFVFGSPRLIHRTIMAGEREGLTFHRLLWMYKPNDCTYPWRGWLLTSEAIAVFSRGKPDKWAQKHYCHDVYTFNHTKGELPKGMHHPSVKPLAVMRDLAEKSTGLTILDPFMGSGTTGVAALQTGRRFIGIEKEQTYFDIAAQRLVAAQQTPHQLTMEAA